MRKLFIVAVLTYLLCFLIIPQATKPETRPAQVTQPVIQILPVTQSPPTTATATTSSTTSSTTSTTTISPPGALQAEQFDLVIFGLDPALPCLEWAPMALQVGWQPEHLPQLLKILFRESRCQPNAFSGSDAGLSQINGTAHTEWLNEQGLSWPESMFVPELNLKFALDLFNSRQEQGKCGWAPWSIKC